MLGNLVIQWSSDVKFELSGMTDKLREVVDGGDLKPGAFYYDICSTYFPLGCIVTFKYTSLTEAGIPREARYWRKRND